MSSVLSQASGSSRHRWRISSGGLEVEVVGVELEPVGVHQGRAGLDAEQRGVRLGVLGPACSAGRWSRRAGARGRGRGGEVALGAALDVEAVVHELDVDVLLAEDVAQLARGLACLVVQAEAQLGLDLARRAARRRDEALAVGGEQLAVDARPLRVDLVERGDASSSGRGCACRTLSCGEHRHVGVGAAAGDVVAAAVAPADLGAVACGGCRA